MSEASDQMCALLQTRQARDVADRDRLWREYFNRQAGYLPPDDQQVTPSGLLIRIRLREVLTRAQTMQSVGAAKTLIRAALAIIDEERRDIP